MRIFFTKAAFQRAIDAAVRSEPDASDLMVRYSENPGLMKKAVAAWFNVEVDAVSKCNITENSILIEPVKRAIRAYAAGLKELRHGL